MVQNFESGDQNGTPAGGQPNGLHAQMNEIRANQPASNQTGDKKPPTNPPTDNAQQSATTGIGALGNVTDLAYADLILNLAGHDSWHLEDRAYRWFQEKLLHHHAINNPRVWSIMGDVLMHEEHLASQGGNFKPDKLKTLQAEIKDEAKKDKTLGKISDSDAKDAADILADMQNGARSPYQYLVAAVSVYREGILKADQKSLAESKTHRDEKRVIGRESWESGEVEHVDANTSQVNGINPIERALAEPISFRMDLASLLDRYGTTAKQPDWAKAADDLRAQARTIYNLPDGQPASMSEPTRRILRHDYPSLEQP